MNKIFINFFILYKAQACKDTLKKMLADVEHCSLTCDGWTSVGQNSYLGVTVHFVVDWRLKSYVLALKHLQKSHTAENLLAELKEVMKNAGVCKKVVTVSADGAFNIKKVIFPSGLKTCLPLIFVSHNNYLSFLY